MWLQISDVVLNDISMLWRPIHWAVSFADMKICSKFKQPTFMLQYRQVVLGTGLHQYQLRRTSSSPSSLLLRLAKISQGARNSDFGWRIHQLYGHSMVYLLWNPKHQAPHQKILKVDIDCSRKHQFIMEHTPYYCPCQSAYSLPCTQCWARDICKLLQYLHICMNTDIACSVVHSDKKWIYVCKANTNDSKWCSPHAERAIRSEG